MTDLFLYLFPEFGPAAILPAIAAATLILTRLRTNRVGRAPSWWRRVETLWLSLARRPVLATALLCSTQIAGVAIRYLVAGPPIPHIHDEFSYLMAGETFASGRLAYPTHPMWVHFESPHIIQVPTQASFYPPGQSIALAAGFLLGHPWIGVILSTLLMIVAVYWAGRQWLAPFWSLPVGVLGLLVVFITYWTNSYWGGAVNAIAGALVLGSAGVLRRRASWPHFTLLAAGIALCAITRPFEGMILALSTCGWLLFRISRRGSGALRNHLRAAGPAMVVLSASAGMFLYYNYAVTGNPLRMPYSEGADQYVARRKFVFQEDPPTPTYRHKVLHDVYVGLMRQGFSSYWRVLDNFSRPATIFFGIALTPLFFFALALPLLGWRGNLLPPVLFSAAGIGAMLTLPWIHPHYYAPFTAAALIATVTALRVARCFERASGRRGWIIVAAAIILLAVRGGSNVKLQINVDPSEPAPWARQKSSIEEGLSATPHSHIIFVRYAPEHDWNVEWVYNHADIDRAPVVWAREMDPEQNARLLKYFSARKAWLIEADAAKPSLKPYPRPGR